MVTDQNYSSDISSEQEVIRYMKKLAQSLGLNEQNAKVYSVFFCENSALKKELKYYHSQYNILERKVKKLKKDVKSLKDKLEDLNEYVDKKTVFNLIYEIVLSLNIKKCKDSFYLSKSSEDSDE